MVTMPRRKRKIFRISAPVIVLVLVAIGIVVNIYFGLIFVDMMQRAASLFDDVSTKDCGSPLCESSDVCDLSNILVAIKSGGSNQRYRNRRNLWRNSICAHTYQKHRIPYRFMIGLPIHHNINIDSHNQAARDTPEEIDDALQIRNESKIYRDIQLFPIRDIYEELHLKIIHIFDWLTKEATGPLVVIHDDEYCADVDELLSLCNETVSDVNGSHIFAGNSLWGSPEYDSQRGFDGSFSPYFSGAINVLSTDLVKNIMEDEDTVYAGIWASHADDLQVGRWVDKQKKRNNTAPVKVLQRPKLLVSVPEPIVPDPIVIDDDRLKECKPVQISTQCNAEAVNLGDLSTPAECAKLTASNPLCSDTYMFSSTEPSWGCRCCSSVDTPPLTGNNNWALYSASDCGVTKVKIS